MPRPIRQIFSHTPHHIVQRGCRREKVFFDKTDFRTYIRILNKFSRKYNVELWCYCLMPNHIHLIVFPKNETSISKMICEAHRTYSEYINKKMGWKGHLWERRFYSYPMDLLYTLHAIRYVLRNPVGLPGITLPEQYRWSNARALIDNVDNGLLGNRDFFNLYHDWKEYLHQPTPKEIVRALEQNETKGKFLFTHDE